MLGSDYPVMQHHIPAEQRLLSYIAMKTLALKLVQSSAFRNMLIQNLFFLPGHDY